MRNEQSHQKSHRITTEGDTLYYEVRGQGRPLLMIPGGGGDGGSYSIVAEILSAEFKVITYDRRANGRSTMNFPENFDMNQQSRDAVAVLDAAGERSAFVFGNSSGAVIALDMAQTQPHAVKAVIAHEPPLARIHPDAKKWQHLFTNVYNTAHRYGSTLAMLKFAFGIGIDFSFGSALKAHKAARKVRLERGDNYLPRKAVTKYFLEQELLPVTNYLPEIESMKKNRVKIFMAAGKRSLEKKRFYAQTAQVLAEKLGCELVVFPGHHASFIDMPNEFAATLRRVIYST
jgi:pimeloyl-ACP methyl ester carboxylesterase